MNRFLLFLSLAYFAFPAVALTNPSDPGYHLIKEIPLGADATVIDPIRETVVKVIDLGGGPEYPTADGKSIIYDDIEENNEIASIDTRTLTVKARWPVAPAGAPVGMGMDREHRRLFSAGRKPQILVMMDADNGKIIQSLSISAGVDADTFEPATGLLFISTREGKIHIFHEDSASKLTEVETVKTESSSWQGEMLKRGRGERMKIVERSYQVIHHVGSEETKRIS